MKRQENRQTRGEQGASTWLLASLVALALAPAFLIGSVHAPVVMGWAGLCALLAATAAARLWRQGQSPRLSWLALAAAALAATAALQLLPLPAGLLALLSPENAQARAALPPELGLGGGGPLTLGQAETALALVRWAALALAACGVGWWLALSAASARKLPPLLAQAFVVAGAAQTLIGLGQTLAGTGGAVLGLWQSSRSSLALVSGTFVNGNHAGTFLVMASLSGLGAAAAQEPGRRRALWGALAGLCATGAVLSGSRGALVTLALCGAGLLGHLFWSAGQSRAQEPRGGQGRWLPWVAAALLPLGAGALLWTQATLPRQLAWELSTSGSVQELGSEFKVQMIRAGASLIGRFPLLGQGADAFAYSAPLALEQQVAARVSFVESDPIQLLLDFGLLVGGAALLAALWSWRGLLLPRRDEPLRRLRPAEVALGWALAAWCLSALVSFNAEALGLALPALVLALALLQRRRRDGPLRLPRLAAPLLVAALSLLALLGAWMYREAAPQQRALAQQIASGDPAPAQALLPVVARGLWRAPHDGHQMGQAALLLLQERPHLALALARASVRAAPGSVASHLALARAARGQDPAQAARSYRVALERLRQIPKALGGEVWMALETDERRVEAIPPRHEALRAVMLWLLESGKEAEALSLATELQARYPESLEAQEFAVKAALANGQPLLAELFSVQLLGNFPEEPRAYLMAARAQDEGGKKLQALSTLARGVERLPGDKRLRMRRAALVLQVPLDQAPPQADGWLREDLEKLRRETLGDPAERARYFALSGQRWERLGKPERAKLDYERARRAQADK